MAFLSPEARNNLKPVINAFGYMLTIAVMVSLACKYVLSGYPPFVAWLEPLAEIVIIFGAGILGLVVYSNNKLIK